MMPNRKRKSNRRSSILKGGSPRDNILSEVDTNVEETTTNVRKSRRVSFAATYTVKEFLKDSPKVPVANNCDVPTVPQQPGPPFVPAEEGPIESGNITQWGNVTMDMTETIALGIVDGPRFSSDPSPISKVDSQSLLKRISGLRSSLNPRNLNDQGLDQGPSYGNSTVVASTGDGFTMDFTQCVGSSQEVCAYNESRTGKGFAEKTVIFQDETAGDMSVTMLQPPLNMSTLNPVFGLPQTFNPAVETKSLLSKLGAFKKTADNSAWEKTRLHISGDDSAIMELTCFPNATMSTSHMQAPASAERFGVEPEEVEEPVAMIPKDVHEVYSAPEAIAPKVTGLAGPSLSPIKTGQSVSEMDLTCMRDKANERRRVSFAPIISTAFVLNESTSTVASEPPTESFATGLASFPSISPENPPLFGSASNVSGVGPIENAQEVSSAKKPMLVTSSLLSKLSAGPSKPKNPLSASMLLSKLSEGASRSSLFGSENDMNLTSGIPAKPTAAANKTTVFVNNDMDMTNVLPPKATGVANKTTVFDVENDMEMTGVILPKVTGVGNKTIVFSSGNDMDMTGVIPSKSTGAVNVVNKTTVFDEENNMEMTGVIPSKYTGVANQTTFANNDMDMTNVLPPKRTDFANKTTVFEVENDMEMTGVIPTKPTGVASKTTMFGADNDMEMTGVVPFDSTGVVAATNAFCDGAETIPTKLTSLPDKSTLSSGVDVEITDSVPTKQTGVVNQTTIFLCENEMETTKVDSNKSIVTKATGISNKSVVFPSENEINQTDIENTEDIAPKSTGFPNRTTVFSSENDMEMTGVIATKPTGAANKTTVFASGNDMEMTRFDTSINCLDPKPTAFGNKTTMFSAGNDMEMTGIIPSKPTGLPNKTTMFVNDNDMEMTRVNAEMTRNDMEMTRADMEITRADMEITKGDMEITKGDMEITRTDMEITRADLEITRANMESTKINFDSTRNPGTRPTRPSGLPNISAIISSEYDMEKSCLDKTSGLSAQHGGLSNMANQNDIQMMRSVDIPQSNEMPISSESELVTTATPELGDIRQTNTVSVMSLHESDRDSENCINKTVNSEFNHSVIDPDDDEIIFKLPAESEEASISNTHQEEGLHSDKHNEVVPPVSRVSRGSHLVQESEIPDGVTAQSVKIASEPLAVDGTSVWTERSIGEDNLEKDENIADVSLELVELTGDQHSLIKDSVFLEDQKNVSVAPKHLAASSLSDITDASSIMAKKTTGVSLSATDNMSMDVRNVSVAPKHSATSSVSHISDITDASSIMPKTTRGVSFSAIDDMSMISDITSFDDFLAIFGVMLYDPVSRNSMCPAPVGDNESLAEKLKVLYCMEPELHLILEGNERFTALITEHETVFRAKEAMALPDLVEAIKNEETKKKMQGFIQKIHKICYEQARCDVKKIRRDMAEEVKSMLKEKCAKLDKDIKLLSRIPGRIQSFQEDKSLLDEATSCLNTLREVKNRADSLEEQATKCSEREQELRAQIESLKAELQSKPSPGKPIRDQKNLLFRLRESVAWKMTEYGPHGGSFSWLNGLFQLQLKFGEQLADCPNHRIVKEKSFKCCVGKNAKCYDSLAARLMADSNVLQKVDCETTRDVPQVLQAFSECDLAIDTIRKDLSAIEWFHDVVFDDRNWLVFTKSEYKTASKLKLFLKFDPDSLNCSPQVIVEPIFGKIREDRLLEAVKGIPTGSGFFKQLMSIVELHLLQCPL